MISGSESLLLELDCRSVLPFRNDLSGECLGDNLATLDDERVRPEVINVVWRFSAPGDVCVVALDRCLFHLERGARLAKLAKKDSEDMLRAGCSPQYSVG